MIDSIILLESARKAYSSLDDHNPSEKKLKDAIFRYMIAYMLYHDL